MNLGLQELVERRRKARTLAGFLREGMEGVETGRRHRNLKERLGFKGMGCCGVKWSFKASNMSVREYEEEENQIVGQIPAWNSHDPAYVGQIPPEAGTGLEAALAAELHFRAAQDGEGETLSSTTTSTTVMTITTPGKPLRVSLMRLLKEEVEGVDGEKEIEKGEGGSDGLCCVCMGRRKDAAFIPCGHTFCRVCSRELWLNRGSCPLCNRSVLEILDIF